MESESRFEVPAAPFVVAMPCVVFLVDAGCTSLEAPQVAIVARRVILHLSHTDPTPLRWAYQFFDGRHGVGCTPDDLTTKLVRRGRGALVLPKETAASPPALPVDTLQTSVDVGSLARMEAAVVSAQELTSGLTSSEPSADLAGRSIAQTLGQYAWAPLSLGSSHANERRVLVVVGPRVLVDSEPSPFEALEPLLGQRRVSVVWLDTVASTGAAIPLDAALQRLPAKRVPLATVLHAPLLFPLVDVLHCELGQGVTAAAAPRQLLMQVPSCETPVSLASAGVAPFPPGAAVVVASTAPAEAVRPCDVGDAVVCCPTTPEGRAALAQFCQRLCADASCGLGSFALEDGTTTSVAIFPLLDGSVVVRVVTAPPAPASGSPPPPMPGGLCGALLPSLASKDVEGAVLAAVPAAAASAPCLEPSVPELVLADLRRSHASVYDGASVGSAEFNSDFSLSDDDEEGEVSEEVDDDHTAVDDIEPLPPLPPLECFTNVPLSMCHMLLELRTAYETMVAPDGPCPTSFVSEVLPSVLNRLAGVRWYTSGGRRSRQPTTSLRLSSGESELLREALGARQQRPGLPWVPGGGPAAVDGAVGVAAAVQLVQAYLEEHLKVPYDAMYSWYTGLPAQKSTKKTRKKSKRSAGVTGDLFALARMGKAGAARTVEAPSPRVHATLKSVARVQGSLAGKARDGLLQVLLRFSTAAWVGTAAGDVQDPAEEVAACNKFVNLIDFSNTGVQRSLPMLSTHRPAAPSIQQQRVLLAVSELFQERLPCTMVAMLSNFEVQLPAELRPFGKPDTGAPPVALAMPPALAPPRAAVPVVAARKPPAATQQAGKRYPAIAPGNLGYFSRALCNSGPLFSGKSTRIQSKLLPRDRKRSSKAKASSSGKRRRTKAPHAKASPPRRASKAGDDAIVRATPLRGKVERVRAGAGADVRAPLAAVVDATPLAPAPKPGSGRPVRSTRRLSRDFG